MGKAGGHPLKGTHYQTFKIRLQTDDKVIHKLSFRLGSELSFCDLQDLLKLVP